jgi:outer membrane protein assembly factor BamB
MRSADARIACSAAILAASAACLAAPDDWPKWRGPRHDGISRETDWTTDGRGEPLWRTNVGLGHSTCSIAAGRLYTLGFDVESKQDIVRCLEALTGETIWTAAYPATLMAVGHSGGTLTTPTVDGDRVYISTRIGELRCLDAATGEVRWQRDMAKDAGTTSTIYGFGGSPLVIGDLVVCNVSRTVALDKLTGAAVWTTDDVAAIYATPTPCEVGGRPGIAAFAREGLYIYDRADGAKRFEFPWRKGDTTVNASTPVIIDDHRIFISSGYNHGGALVDFSSGVAVSVWESRAMRTRLSGCVLVRGRGGKLLFGFDESVLKCLDLAGEERWRKRGMGMGALTAAGDRLIVISERGELIVAKATADSYEELSRTTVFPAASGGVCWASPVLASGLIYCRNSQGELACLDHRRPE